MMTQYFPIIVEQRRGMGGHRQFAHPDNRRVVTVSVHTKKEVGTRRATAPLAPGWRVSRTSTPPRIP